MSSVKLSPMSMWLIALLITALGIIVQRRGLEQTPVPQEAVWQERTVRTALARRHVGPGGQRVVIEGVRADWRGTAIWRPYGKGAEFQRVALRNLGTMLAGEIPAQPRGSAVEYRLEVEAIGGKLLRLPAHGTVISRYVGAVPLWINLPHLVLLYLALLLGLRAGLEALALGPNAHNYAGLALIAFVFGGLIFGPLSKFRAYNLEWQGLDSTSVKTAVLVLAWLVPVILRARGRRARRWIILAALLSVIAFLIPHSLYGTA